MGAYHELLINRDCLVGRAIDYVGRMLAGYMNPYLPMDERGQRASGKRLNFLVRQGCQHGVGESGESCIGA